MIPTPGRTQHVLVFAAAAWLAVALPSSATVLLPADFEEMVAASQVIVHGRVVDVRATRSGSRRTIESLVTISVLDALKGTAGSHMTFRVPGGQMGRYRRVLVGAPSFAAGEEVVLFLRGRAPAMPTVFGLGQGVYRVAHAAGQAVVNPPPAAATQAADGRVTRGDRRRRPVALPEFALRVRTLDRERR